MANVSTSATITVEYQELKGVAQTIKNELANYRSIVNDIENTVNGIPDWEGTAHTEYVDKVMGFKNDHQKFFELLENYIKFLEKAASDYENVETSNKNIAGTINEGI